MQKELNHKVRKCSTRGIQCRALYRNRTFNHYFDCDRAGWDPPDLYDHRNTNHGHGHRFLYNISCKWFISGSRS